MPIFDYKALDGRGKTIRGAIDAESLQDAKQKLARKQILAIHVALVKKAKMGCPLKRQDLQLLTREMARLLQAGLPLYETLAALEEKYRSHQAHSLLLDLCDQIRSGRQLSKAAEAHPLAFDPLCSAMIASAEKSGRLGAALEDLSKMLARELQMKKQLVSALLYPALLGGFCLIVLSALLFFVVPSLFELFEGRNLHPFTRVVFACSRAAVGAKGYLAAALAVSIGAGYLGFATPRGRQRIKAVFFRLPGLSDLLAKASLARFFRASATLVQGGIPALFAFRHAIGSLQHAGLQASIESAIAQLSEGASFQKALEGRPFIPPLVPRMMAIAQEGGNLCGMMDQIASIYEEELERSFSLLSSLLQPVLLLILGGIVGFVLLSVLLPLTDVSTFAS